MDTQTFSISDLKTERKILCLLENKPSKESIPHPGVLKFLTLPISSFSFGKSVFFFRESTILISS